MENINVAIPLTSSETNMSAEEFQNLLTSWFEEKGIISDLRSQLRFKMINVLKNTAIGRKISKRTISHHSLSKQAINLIVAEFLMQNRCHYSLSVFNTEAALTNIFPEYLRLDDSQELFRYSSENLSNIFELIGIPKNSEIGKEALNFYCNNRGCSVLSCLVSSMCNISNRIRKPIVEEMKSIDFEKESDFVKQLGSTLLNSDISSDNVEQILKKIETLHDGEMKMMENKYQKIFNKLKTEASISIQKLHEVDKSKRALENKLSKVIGENDAMKVQMNGILREKLQNERQLLNQNITKPAAACSSKHCSEECEKNINLVDELQGKNQELYRKTETLSEELVNISKRCNEQILQKVTPVCSGQHCSDMCEKNRFLVDDLRERNKELHVRNEAQSDELCNLLKKYNEQITQKVIPVCSSQHCSEKCEKNINLVDELKEKVRELSRNTEIQSEELRHLLEKYNEQIIQRVTPACSNQHCSNECIKHINLVDELRDKNRELSKKNERDSEELYGLLRTYKEQLIQKVTPICSSRHCSDKCEKNMNFVDELRASNQELSRKSEIQAEELFHLSSKYKELLHDFLDSQRKVNFLKAKVNKNDGPSRVIFSQTEKIDLRVPEDNFLNTNDSDSSTGVTEEILREARLRLQILEEESNKIEKKFKNTHQLDSNLNL